MKVLEKAEPKYYVWSTHLKMTDELRLRVSNEVEVPISDFTSMGIWSGMWDAVRDYSDALGRTT